MSFTLLPPSVRRWLVPAQNGTGLVPANGYFLKYFEAGLGTGFPKAVYQDADGTPYPTPTNTVPLNSEGYAVVYFGPGTYAEQVTDADGNQIAYFDPISSGGGSGGVGAAFLKSVIASDDPATNGLAQLDTNANTIAYCAGYFDPADGGSGMFYNKESSDPDDTGYVIASTFDSNKRWFRIPDEDGKVRAASFGVVDSAGGDIVDLLIAADAYAASIKATLLIGRIPNSETSSITFTAPNVEFEEGAYLKGTLDTDTGDPVADFVFEGIVTANKLWGDSSLEAGWIVTRYLSVTFNQKQVAEIEWLGARSNENETSVRAINKAAFDAIAASGAGVVRVSAGDWFFNTADNYTLPLTSQIWIVDGTIKDQVPTTLFTKGIYCDSYGVGKDFQVDNDLTVGGDSEFTGDIHVNGQATGNLTVQSALIASAIKGSVGGINGGADQFYSSGAFVSFIGSTDIKNSPFYVVALPLNSLNADGDRIRLSMSGFATGTTQDFFIKIGSQTLLNRSGALGDGSSQRWILNGEIIRITTSTVRFYGWISMGNGALLPSGDPSTDTSCDFSSDQVLTFLMTSISAATIKLASLEYIPVSPQ